MSTKDTVQNFARNVWLAGLGAYGKGSEAITDKIDKTYEESNQLFNDLVVKGGEIQTSLEAKLKEQTRFELKVDEVRAKLGLNQNVSDEQIDQLSQKVDALTEIVAALAQKRLADATEQQTKEAAETVAKPATRSRKAKETTIKPA
jgi:hypothetical protein